MDENIKIIKENLDRGIDYKNEKKKFFKIVDFIKVHKIKDDDVLEKVSGIRHKMVSTWRPKQFTVRSGVFLWALLVILGSFVVSITFLLWSVLAIIGIWRDVIYVITLIFGWLLINIGIHNLGHYVAGKVVGINFNSWVIREAIFQWGGNYNQRG